MTDPQEPQDYDGSSGQVTRSNSTDSSFDYLEPQLKSPPVFGASTSTSGASQHATPGLSYPPPRADSTSEYPTLTSGYPLQSPLGSLHSVPLTPWRYPYNSATPITTASTYGTGLYPINTGSSHPPHSAGTGLAPGSGAWLNVYFGAAPHTAIGLGSGTFGNSNTGQMYGGMDGLGTGGIGGTGGFGAGAGTGLEGGIEQAYTGLSPLFAGFTTTSPITPFSAQHVRPALASLTSVSSSNTSSTSTDSSWVTARKRSSTMQTLESAASASPATPSSYQAHDYLSFIPNLPSREASASQESNQMESLRSSFSSFSSLSNLDQSQSTPATPFSHPHPYAYPSTRSSGSSTSTGTLDAHRTPHSAHPDNHGSGSTPQLIRHPSAPSMFNMAMTRHRVHPTSTPSTVRRVVPPRIDLSAGGGSDDWWAKEGEGRSASSGLGGFGQRDSVDKAPRFKPTKEQQAMLIGSYNENKNPGTEARARLANAISTVGPETSQKTVQIWFQNRRSKARAKERSLNLPKSAVRSRSTTVDSSVDLETLRALTRDDSPDLHLVPLSVLCVGTWTRFLTPGNGMLNPDLGAAIAFDNDPRLMLYVVHKAETFRISIALQRDNVTQLEVAAQSNLHINTDAVAVRFILKGGTAVFASWKRGDTERSEISAGIASGGVSVGGMSAGDMSAGGMSAGGTMVDMSGAFSGEMDGGDRRQSDGTRGTGDNGRWTPVDDFTGGEAAKGGRCELTGEKETLLPGFARIQAWLQSGSSGKMEDGGEMEMNGSGRGTDFGSWRFPQPQNQHQTHATGQDMQMGGQGHYFGQAQAPDQNQPQPQYQHDPHQLHSQTDQSSPLDGVVGTSWPGSFSPSSFPLDSSTTPISATGYNPANMFAGYSNHPGISPGQAYSHSSVSTDSPDLSPSEMGYRQRAISAPVPMQLGVDHAFGAHALGGGNSQSPQQHFSPLEPSEMWMETGSSLGFGDLTTPKSGQFGEVFKREREHPRPTTVESQSTSSTPAPYTASNANSTSASASTSIPTSTSSSTPVSSSKAGATTSDAISHPTSARQDGQDGVMW